MITRFEIDGFKSFGKGGACLDLSRLNLVVGANASGKTNLLAGLQLLRDLVQQDAESALNSLGGVAEVRNKIERQRSRPKHLRITARLDDVFPITPAEREPAASVRASDFSYTVEIDLRATNERPEIVGETLSATIESHGTTHAYRLHRTRDTVEVADPSALNGRGYDKYPVPEQDRSRTAVAAIFSLPTSCFRGLLGEWTFFNISPLVARRPYQDFPNAVLGARGQNLSVVLRRLERAGGEHTLGSIISGLRGLVPGLKSVKPVKAGYDNQWVVTVAEEKIRTAIGPSSISDGTIRLLAVMVVAHLGYGGHGLIAIEEPENGLHPHLSEHIIETFREASRSTQFIITTHNPEFLGHVHPEEVLIFGKVDGFTRVRRADSRKEIDSFRKHFDLGELWVQGVFDEMFEP